MKLKIVLFVFSSIWVASCSRKPADCGMDPGLSRILSTAGPLNNSDAWGHVCLLRVSMENEKTVLRIAERRRDNDNLSYIISEQYFSDDEGRSWHKAGNRANSDTNITTTQSEDLIMIESRANPQIIYTNVSANTPQFKRSLDGGKTVMSVTPKFQGDWHIQPGQFDIISTSPSEQRRVYAHVYVGTTKAICRSDDYGDHFISMVEGASFVVESKSDPFWLYGFGDDGLMQSTDGGYRWRILNGGKELFSPLYANAGMTLSTKPSSEMEIFSESMNSEWYSPCWLRQIEIDPKDARIIYVVCVKGLYRSADGGETFRLLGLAENQYKGIAKIAIDPNVTRNIYAVVGTSIFNKSEDAGCTWSLLRLPELEKIGRTPRERGGK